jgi:hypothetical protein
MVGSPTHGQTGVVSYDPVCSYGTQQKFILCDISHALLSSGSDLGIWCLCFNKDNIL